MDQRTPCGVGGYADVDCEQGKNMVAALCVVNRSYLVEVPQLEGRVADHNRFWSRCWVE